VSGHRDPRCSYTASRGVHCRGQLNTGDHRKYRQTTPIAVVIFSEHVEVNRGDGCSNEGSALAVLYLIVCYLQDNNTVCLIFIYMFKLDDYMFEYMSSALLIQIVLHLTFVVLCCIA